MSSWQRYDGLRPMLPIEAYAGEDKAEPMRESRFFPASDFEGKHVPPRQWVVHDLVPSGTVTLLGGDGGTGKSLLALQLAYAVATGGAWLDRRVTPGAALYISAEDDQDELHRRIADVAHAGGTGLAELYQLTLRSLAGEDALLAMQDGRTGALSATTLFKEVEERVQAERPVLVVLDTLADLFPGNENDRAQARQFIGLLRGLAIRHQCAVVLLAHPSLSGMSSGAGTSGTTGWNNSVRSRLYLWRVVKDGDEPNPDARVLSTKKANYGPAGGEINLTWRDGVFIADAPETMLDRLSGSMKAERVFMKLLKLHTDQGRRVNAGGGTTYAPRAFADHPDSEGCNKRVLRVAMETLLSQGKITIVKEGPPSRPVSFIEAATP